jgi:predicted transcriptional regulator
MPNVDDRRVGLVIRALRRRRGWRQVDLAAAASVSQSLIARAEA